MAFLPPGGGSLPPTSFQGGDARAESNASFSTNFSTGAFGPGADNFFGRVGSGQTTILIALAVLGYVLWRNR